MPKIFGFCTVFGSWLNVFDYAIGFNKLNAIFGCLTVTYFISLLFVFTAFDTILFFEMFHAVMHFR